MLLYKDFICFFFQIQLEFNIKVKEIDKKKQRNYLNLNAYFI